MDLGLLRIPVLVSGIGRLQTRENLSKPEYHDIYGIHPQKNKKIWDSPFHTLEGGFDVFAASGECPRSGVYRCFLAARVGVLLAIPCNTCAGGHRYLLTMFYILL